MQTYNNKKIISNENNKPYKLNHTIDQFNTQIRTLSVDFGDIKIEQLDIDYLICIYSINLINTNYQVYSNIMYTMIMFCIRQVTYTIKQISNI